jgi:hypothetical protein
MLVKQNTSEVKKFTQNLEFEVSTSVTLNIAVLWDTTPYTSYRNDIRFL